MSSLRIETFQLPSHWASYFVNSDPSGLEESDIQAADGWWYATFQPDQSVSCTDVAEDGNFCKFHDADRWCLPCEVASFTFLIHQEG